MTSDKSETWSASSGGGDPGSPGRPSRTIELEADEVEIEVTEDEAPDETDPAEAGAASSGEKPGEEEKKPRKPPPPPPRTPPREVKSFFTHLAAGIAGGLIGVIAAGIGLDRLPLAGLMGQGAAPQPPPQLTQRLDALEQKLSSQSQALDTALKPRALEAIDSRLKILETKPAPGPAVPDDVSARLAKLEGTLKTLQESASEDGSGGLAQTAAISARIGDVSADMHKRTAALKQDIAALKAALDARPPGAATAPADGALTQKIAALEDKIAELANRPPPAPAVTASAPDTGGAALALAFENLRRAIERGGPYAEELEMLGRAAPEGLDLAALGQNASSGAPTAAALLSELPGLLRDARAALASSGDDSFLDRLVSNAQQVVRVRRIGPNQGSDTASVLARMEAAMKAGDLAGVVREAGTLDRPALAVMQPWLERARVRQASEAGLDALGRQLIARLDPGARR